ncbi:hypothetical protein RJ640_006719 [Escallonia rubra]|uniref:AP2/ERF domain-containing protein n=1 Tax=Escallonia rubra TaxID=112253 RepID=A0AA88UBW5_9ASTE|nr:hypothetical protein RJ640_006719 [Escallonia rubra]
MGPIRCRDSEPSHERKTLAIGTFGTAEEAALACDRSSISFCGIENARTNFCYPFLAHSPPSSPLSPSPPPPPPPTPELECGGQYCMGMNFNEDDESQTNASILQSFSQ